MSETGPADDPPDCPDCGGAAFVTGYRGGAAHICHKCGQTFGDTDTDERPPHRDPDVLRSLYHGQGMSLAEVADELQVHPDTVLCWMERHGIKRRSQRWTPDAETVTDIRARLLGDDSVRGLAAEYDRTRTVIRRVATDDSLAADIGPLSAVGSTGRWAVQERDGGGRR
jgi:transposase-like protein